MATCGKKVTMLRCEDYLVLFKVVERSTLYPLVSYSYQMINKGLLSAFFLEVAAGDVAIPPAIGMMIITLDDVSCMFHFPCVGSFFKLYR